MMEDTYDEIERVNPGAKGEIPESERKLVKKPKVGKELDLSLAVKHEHPDIKAGPQYLCQIDGKWFMGEFSREWYGWNFEGWLNDSGLQFDAPGWNSSSWQRVFEMVLP